jgi:1-acyl-sn-glycerol-3-phosphate acyltransferase
MMASSMSVGSNHEQRSPAAVWAPVVGGALFEAFCRTFFTLYSPLTVGGREHLPDGPFLLCSNHNSHADSAALMTASGRSFQEFALLGASDYFFRSRNLRWILSSLMNVIPIERRPGPKSLSTCLAECRRFLANRGKILILYPEGTRSLDGEMREFKSGVGWLASALQLPIVPAYIEGSHQILPKGRSFPRPHPVTVRFGEAFCCASSLRAESRRESRRAIAEQLAWQVRRLMPESACPEFATMRGKR